mgnify:CR=1 FL=1
MSSTESFWSEIKVYEGRLKQEPSSYCFAPLTEVYLRAGLLDDALATARTGVARHPGYVAGQMALARVCHQKGLLEECRKALEVVTEAVPENVEAQRMLAQLYREAGQDRAAARSLQTLLEFSPADMTARIELEALQRRAAELVEDELELIEFTEEDIIEEGDLQPVPASAKPEPVLDDTLVERVKPVAGVIDDPWSILTPEPPAAGVLPTVEPVEPPTVPSVWSMPEPPESEPESDSSADDPQSLWRQPLGSVTESQPAEDPLATSTLAELYVTQGFIDKAIEIYRAILERQPDNREAADRLALLEQQEEDTAAAEQAAAAAMEQLAPSVTLPVHGEADKSDAVVVLEGWLDNIRRLRICH